MKSKSNNSCRVFISGAAGGLGLEVVHLFVKAGYLVIATDIDQVGLEKMEGPENLILKKLDVTNPENIRAVADETGLEKYGLDILISLAGIYDAFPVTEADPVRLKKMMDVNFTGNVKLVQAMLKPLLKKQGRVIIISSESYKIQAMFQPYMISKSALESYCRVARQELALQNIKLAVVRPGAIATPLLNWMKSPETTGEYRVYENEFIKSVRRSAKMVGKIILPEKVASKIFHAATEKNPKRVYRINNSWLLIFIALLPASWFDWLIIRLFREPD